ncbi:XRE family transcriptional regulator [Pseudoclavibacter sp. AY1F1]|uniref:helix-turn-helix domain-containing protein n=1 Tax=Pseudoclavibacter sp. AY1F1 TaxID=2080583 RepID=UPI000CE86E2A|nr:XRE family transcriptional regulator [Pseudoclavibacter sp. AY1F1]PPF41917.1 XRE family transcriptional regulator [Pseudoclavibacter sp. AY1F1]
MDESTANLASAIGVRVRQERQTAGWTLEQLAESAGVSRRTLVSIEQGSANPSIGTLLRLSDTLGVELAALVEQPEAAAPLKVTPAGEGAALWTGQHGGSGVLLATTKPPNVVELWEWAMEVGERHESEAHTLGTRELAQVHDGEITISTGADSATLGPGDAISFFGDAPHSYANSGQAPARFTLTVFEPGVGTASGSTPHTTHDRT